MFFLFLTCMTLLLVGLLFYRWIHERGQTEPAKVFVLGPVDYLGTRVEDAPTQMGEEDLVLVGFEAGEETRVVRQVKACRERGRTVLVVHSPKHRKAAATLGEQLRVPVAYTAHGSVDDLLHLLRGHDYHGDSVVYGHVRQHAAGGTGPAGAAAKKAHQD